MESGPSILALGFTRDFSIEDMSDQSNKEGQPKGDKPLNSDTRPEGDDGTKAETTSVKGEDPKSGAKSKKKSSVPSKRKVAPKDEPSKVPRRSARGAQQPSVHPVKMLQFLLSSSSSSTDLCRPKDEIEDLKTRGANTRTYSSSNFTPFEELICAVILSRPISHALGLRSIRTLFNEPWNLTTPKALREAGPEGRRKALDEARTQHRQKTADELGNLAEALADKLGDNEDDVEMAIVRKECDQDADKVSTSPMVSSLDRRVDTEHWIGTRHHQEQCERDGEDRN